MLRPRVRQDFLSRVQGRPSLGLMAGLQAHPGTGPDVAGRKAGPFNMSPNIGNGSVANRPLVIDLNMPVDVADLSGQLHRFLAWWGTTLSDMLPVSLRRAVPQAPASTQLFVDETRWRFVGGPDGQASIDVDPARDDKALADQILAAAPNFSLQNLEVVLPAGQALRRPVVLPLMHERQVLPAIELQIDRLTPFRAEGVWVGARLAARDAVEGKVVADCVFVPRAAVDAIGSRLRGLGLSVARLDVADEDGQSSGFRLVEPGRATAPQGAGVWRRVSLALVAVGAWLLAGAMWDTAREGEIQSWQAQVQDMKPLAAQSVALRARLEGLSQPVALAAAHKPDAVLSVLLELTRVLPDTARLTVFELNGDTVKIAGVAQEASGLIALLERSPRFREARFLTQVMRQPETSLDRFEIGLSVEGGAR